MLVAHIYLRTGPESAGSSWFERGSANAAAILRGEWWRSVTALTLHADAGHAAANAALGGLLLALLAFLGTSKRADLAGHLCGFVSGVLAGAAVSLLPPLQNRAARAFLAVAVGCVPVAAWLAAFR